MFAFILFSAIVLYSAFAIFISKTTGKIDNLSLNAISAAMVFVVFASSMLFSDNAAHITKSGIGWTTAAALAIAAYGFCLVELFKRGGDVSLIIPIIYGGVIVLTSITGWVFFKEQLRLLHLVGVILISTGIALVAFSRS